MDSLTLSNVFNYQSFLNGNFETFLIEKHISAITRKNYRSDLKNFFDWFAKSGQIPEDRFPKSIQYLVAQITIEELEEYKRDLLLAHTPEATINRRLSSLRMLFRFTQEEGWTTDNPMVFIRNIVLSKPLRPNREDLLNQFRLSLRDEGAAEATVKNYVADVDEFLIWLSQNP